MTGTKALHYNDFNRKEVRMRVTIVVSIASNGYLLQYQDDQGSTDSKVFHFEDKKQMMELIESWMELNNAVGDHTD